MILLSFLSIFAAIQSCSSTVPSLEIGSEVKERRGGEDERRWREEEEEEEEEEEGGWGKSEKENEEKIAKKISLL